jgi:hypothetical protein
MTDVSGLIENAGLWGAHVGVIDVTTGLRKGSGLYYAAQEGPLGPQALDFSVASNSMHLVLFRAVIVPGLLAGAVAKALLALGLFLS